MVDKGGRERVREREREREEGGGGGGLRGFEGVKVEKGEEGKEMKVNSYKIIGE